MTACPSQDIRLGLTGPGTQPGAGPFCPISSAIATSAITGNRDPLLDLSFVPEVRDLVDHRGHTDHDHLASDPQTVHSYDSLIAAAVGAFLGVSPVDYLAGRADFGSCRGSLSVVGRSVFDSLQLTVVECVQSLADAQIVPQLSKRDSELITLLAKVTDYGRALSDSAGFSNVQDLISRSSSLPKEIIERLQVAIELDSSGIAARRIILGEISRVAQEVVDSILRSKADIECDRELVGQLIGIAALGVRFRSDTELLIVDGEGEVFGITAPLDRRGMKLLGLLMQEWPDVSETIVATRRAFDSDIRELSQGHCIVPPSNGMIIRVLEAGFPDAIAADGGAGLDGCFTDSLPSKHVRAGVITEIRVIKEPEIGTELGGAGLGIPIDGFQIIQPGPYSEYSIISSVTNYSKVNQEFELLKRLGRVSFGASAEKARVTLLWEFAERFLANVVGQGAEAPSGRLSTPYSGALLIESLGIWDPATPMGARKIDGLWEQATKSKSLMEAMGAWGITKGSVKAISVVYSSNGDPIETDFLCIFNSATGRLVWIAP